jgi:membrane-bound lytic murein transglycosylase A
MDCALVAGRRFSSINRGLAAALLALVAACGPVIPPPLGGPGRPPVGPAGPTNPAAPPPPPNAVALGVHAGPDVLTMGLTAATAGPALLSFRESCPKATMRNDPSGLTRPADWKPVCDAAATWATGDAARFFTDNFESVVVGDGQGQVTGYYEPEISGTRTHQPGFDVPVYAVPPDLVHARPGDAPVKSNGQTPFGRYDESGHFVPYWDRATIDSGQLANQGLEIAWAADPVEFFFMQIQGSGRLRAPDGTVMRLGYAADNGQNYTGIGSVMKAQGLIGTGPGQYPGSMQGIIQYTRDHPEAAKPLMDQNKAWVFFREITGDGPLGALGVPVRAHVSLAADPLFVPLGAPVFLAMDPALAGATAANGLWVAQDTGGAIKGANRFDSFWGAGADARRVAGGLNGRGSMLLLLPRGTLARLGQ